MTKNKLPTNWPWARVGIDTLKARVKLHAQGHHLQQGPSMPPGWSTPVVERKVGRGGPRWCWSTRHHGLDILVDAYIEERPDGLCDGHVDLELSVATLYTAVAHRLPMNLAPAPAQDAKRIVKTVVEEILVKAVGIDNIELADIVVTRMDPYLDLWPQHPHAFLSLWAQHPPVVAHTAAQDSVEHEDSTTRSNKGCTSVTEYRNATNTGHKGAKRGGCPNRVYDREEAVQSKIKRKYKNPDERKRLLDENHPLWPLLRGCVRIEAEHGREKPRTCKLPTDPRDRKQGFKGDDITLESFADEQLWSVILCWRLLEKGWKPTSKVVMAADERDVVKHLQAQGVRFSLATKALWAMKYGATYVRKHHGIKLSEVRRRLSDRVDDVLFLEEKNSAPDQDVIPLLWDLLAGRFASSLPVDDLEGKLIVLLGTELPGTKAPSRRSRTRFASHAKRLFDFRDDDLEAGIEDYEVGTPVEGPDIGDLLNS